MDLHICAFDDFGLPRQGTVLLLPLYVCRCVRLAPAQPVALLSLSGLAQREHTKFPPKSRFGGLSEYVSAPIAFHY